MVIKAIKTRKVLPGSGSLFELLDKSIKELSERSIVVVTSKVISLCEGRVVPAEGTDKEELIKQESDYYVPREIGKWGYNFTITHNTLISAAGIDESNGGGDYILWPEDPQKSANAIRAYLKKRFGLKSIGVIVIDSSMFAMRYGTLCIPIGHSGFLATQDYRGKPDLFGRPFKVSISSVAGGLAAAAGVVMGEGTEQTPIAIIEDVPFVQFQNRDPSPEELKRFYIPAKDDDLFAPFLNSVKWVAGGRK